MNFWWELSSFIEKGKLHKTLPIEGKLRKILPMQGKLHISLPVCFAGKFQCRRWRYSSIEEASCSG